MVWPFVILLIFELQNIFSYYKIFFLFTQIEKLGFQVVRAQSSLWNHPEGILLNKIRPVEKFL